MNKHYCFRKYIAVFIILALGATLMGPLVAEACLAGDIACAALRAGAAALCKDAPWWKCVAYKAAAEVACFGAKAILCGGSS